jgi:hypothetical protein
VFCCCTHAQLRARDPQLAGIVDAGKFALERLQAQGEALGRLKGLNTIEEDDDGVSH